MARYKKLLVVLDLTAESEQVAAAGRELAVLSDSAIVFLHVVEFVPVEPIDGTLMTTGQIELELVDRATRNLNDLASRLQIPRSSVRIEAGITKAQILRVADEERIDLIIVGSRERHGLAILVNFTEDTILHGAHCDVLAVRLK